MVVGKSWRVQCQFGWPIPLYSRCGEQFLLYFYLNLIITINIIIPEQALLLLFLLGGIYFIHCAKPG